MHAIDALREAVGVTPIPGSPPVVDRELASTGLAFLDVALRQNHVRRLTETLDVVEHGAAERRTEVDVNLSLLDAGQVAGLRLVHARAGADQPPPSTLWVPVARVARQSGAPVEVTDESGVKLARLTQHEASRYLAAGLYQLLKSILSSRPDTRTDRHLSSLLYSVDEARWLIQSALMRLLLERGKPGAPSRFAPTVGTEPSQAAEIRGLALQVLKTVEPDLDQYLGLLDVAMNDYLLIVALDTRREQHLLSYESPLHGGALSGRRADLGQWLRGQTSTYRLTYEARISSTMPSYHLVVRSGASVEIDNLVLTTDCDATLVGVVGRDLVTLASRLERLAGRGGPPSGELTATEKILDLEVQSALRNLAELVRRRRWEAEQAGQPFRDDGLLATSRLSWASVSGERAAGTHRAQQDVADADPTSALIRHPSVDPATLRAAAAELTRMELDRDLALEKDAPGSRAHVYWRRPPALLAPARGITVRATATMSDAGHTRPYSIINYALALAGVVLAIGTFAGGVGWMLDPRASFDFEANRDAVVAVLVLVPGFLYTRLDLPPRHSVAAKVHVVPRVSAHLCVGTMALLAAGVAAGRSGTALRTLFLVALVVLLLCVAALVRQRTSFSPDRLLGAAVPPWARGAGGAARPVRVDAAFYAARQERS